MSIDQALLKIGDKVHYTCSGSGKKENGRVKEIINDDFCYARVVYHCDHKWSEYQNYTGALTKLENLTMGWNHW